MNNALLIGLNYADSPFRLSGCENDADNMTRRAAAAGYRCETVKGIFTADDFYGEMGRLRNSARRTGKTLISVSSHGTQVPEASEQDGYEGGVCFWNGDGIEVVPETDFRKAVAQIPGSVIVLLDLCYAGEMARKAGRPQWSRRFVPFDAGSMPVKTFATAPIAKALPKSSKIYWLLACQPKEVSWDTRTGGLFTNSFCHAYDLTTHRHTVKNVVGYAHGLCYPDQSPFYKCEGGAGSKVLL